MKELFLRIDKETGEIVNARGEVLYVLAERDGEEVYLAPSVETQICNQTALKGVRVCTDWEGPRCTSWEECTASKNIAVEICVDFGVSKPGKGSFPWQPWKAYNTDSLQPRNL